MSVSNIATVTTNQNDAHVFTIGHDGKLYWNVRLQRDSSWESSNDNWRPLPVNLPNQEELFFPIGTPISVVTYDNYMIELFAILSTGQVVQNSRSNLLDQQAWSGWQSISLFSFPLGTELSVVNHGGNITIFALSYTGEIQYNEKLAGTPWTTNWQFMNAALPSRSPLTVLSDVREKYDVFAVGHDHEVYHRFFPFPNPAFYEPNQTGRPDIIPTLPTDIGINLPGQSSPNPNNPWIFDINTTTPSNIPKIIWSPFKAIKPLYIGIGDAFVDPEFDLLTKPSAFAQSNGTIHLFALDRIGHLQFSTCANDKSWSLWRKIDIINGADSQDLSLWTEARLMTGTSFELVQASEFEYDLFIIWSKESDESFIGQAGVMYNARINISSQEKFRLVPISKRYNQHSSTLVQPNGITFLISSKISILKSIPGTLELFVFDLLDKVHNLSWSNGINETTSLWKEIGSPLRNEFLYGFAELHSHPASHLGFGAAENGSSGGLFWGSPGLNLESSIENIHSDLRSCNGDIHDESLNLRGIEHWTRKNVIAEASSITGYSHGSSGHPDYIHWPHALSILHQQMHISFIHRAYLGGLRLMFASITDNQLLARLWRVDFDNMAADPNFDFRSARRQLRFITDQVNANSSWMVLVSSPTEARNAIASNKLAVILSLELDSLTFEQLTTLRNDFPAISQIIPIHLINNAFGGVAIYEDLFNSSNNFVNGKFLEVETDPHLTKRLKKNDTNYLKKYVDHPAIGGLIEPVKIEEEYYYWLGYDKLPETKFDIPSFADAGCQDGHTCGHKNATGLKKSQIVKLLKMGLIVDLAHMSEKSMHDALDLAIRFNYPMMNSHSGIRRLGSISESERGMRSDHAINIACLGGVLGLGTEGGKHFHVQNIFTDGEVRKSSKNTWIGLKSEHSKLIDRLEFFTRDSGHPEAVLLDDTIEYLWVKVAIKMMDSNNPFEAYSIISGGGTGILQSSQLILRIDFSNGFPSKIVDLNFGEEWYHGTLHQIIIKLDPPFPLYRDVQSFTLSLKGHGLPNEDDCTISGFSVDKIIKSPLIDWVNGFNEAHGYLQGRGLTIGTDFNGYAPQIPFNNHSLQVVYNEGINIAGQMAPSTQRDRYPVLGKHQLGNRSFDVNLDGIAHFGLIPDFFQSIFNIMENLYEQPINNIEVNTNLFIRENRNFLLGTVFRSAEDTIMQWEKTLIASRNITDEIIREYEQAEASDAHLRIQIRTGGDGLRSGASVFALIGLKDGRRISLNLNQDRGLDNYNVFEVQQLLPASVKDTDLTFIGIRVFSMGGTGGVFGDNWDLNKVEVEYVSNSRSRLLLRQESMTPDQYYIKRFTGKDHHWIGYMNYNDYEDSSNHQIIKLHIRFKVKKDVNPFLSSFPTYIPKFSILFNNGRHIDYSDPDFAVDIFENHIVATRVVSLPINIRSENIQTITFSVLNEVFVDSATIGDVSISWQGGGRFGTLLEIPEEVVIPRNHRYQYAPEFLIQHVLSNRLVALRANNNRFINVENGGGAGVAAISEGVSLNETFTFEYKGSNLVSFKTINGFYLCAEGGGGANVVADRFVAKQWEEFEVIYVGNNQFAFRAHNGYYLGCTNDGQIVATSNRFSEQEVFIINEIPVAQISIHTNNGNYLRVVQNLISVTLNIIPNKLELLADAMTGTAPQQKFELIDFDNNQTAIRQNGFYWTVNQENNEVVLTRNNLGFLSLFEFIPVDANRFSLRAFNGMFLSAQNGGGGKITADRVERGDWETFHQESILWLEYARNLQWIDIASATPQGHMMAGGMMMLPGQFMTSPNGRFLLGYQPDGNLVLYENSVALWSSRTAGTEAGRCEMQIDGNLVIYAPNNQPLWSSNTWGAQFEGSTLLLTDDGNLRISNRDSQSVWSTNTNNGRLIRESIVVGEYLSPAQSLYSNNRQFRFTYQSDGNLVLYRTNDGAAIWASGTHGQPAGRFEMKADGVLAIYGPNNAMQWAVQYAGAQALSGRLQLSDAGAVNILAADGTVINSIEQLELVSPRAENFIAFRHVVTAGNVPTSMPSITILDHPQLNGNPAALLFVNPVWGNASGGVENPHAFGVWYREERWVIFNQNPTTPMLMGASFLVMATSEENPHVFVHTAMAPSLSMDRTYINHPASNNRPNALLMVTQRFGEYNNREIGLTYNYSGNDQWVIFNKIEVGGDPYNEALHGIPLYAKFNVLVVEDNNVPGINAFKHQALADNIIPAGQHITFIDHASINGKADAHVFFTESWLNTGGVGNRSISALWYDDPGDQVHNRDGYWSLNNLSGHPMEQGRMFNVFVLEEEAGLLPIPPPPVLDERFTFVAYQHRVGTTFNANVNASTLDHPLLNHNPNAMIFANSNYGYRNEGLDNGNLFGVRYNGSNWELASQSGQPNTMNPAYWFNILIAPQGCPNVFTHVATRDSLQSNRTFLDHPLLNGRPDVHLMVTQNLTNGQGNNHEIGVAFTNERWFIFNQVTPIDGVFNEANHGIPEGARFNVLVLSGAEQSNIEVLAHQAAGRNINNNISFMSHPKLDHNREAIAFATMAWLPVLGGHNNPSMIALWYDDELDAWKYKEGFWSVYNSVAGVPMAPGVVFNVFVVT